MTFLTSGLWRRRAALALLLLASPAAAAEPNDRPSSDRPGRIDAAGIAGALLLGGRQTPPDETAAELMRLAQGKGGRVVALRLDGQAPQEDGPSEVIQRLVEKWSAKSGGRLELIHLPLDDRAAWNQAAESLAGAAGVWIESSSDEAISRLCSAEPVATALRELLQRGGVIGGDASFSAFAAEGASPGAAGLALLPDMIVEAPSEGEDNGGSLLAALADPSARIGCAIGPRSALVVEGRMLKQLGEGAVTLRFAEREGHPEAILRLDAQDRVQDLTAMRRYARQRAEPPFPSPAPAKPVVERGTLVIVGGAMPAGLTRQFVELAGGAEASLVVIPVAVPDPLPRRDAMAEAFRRAGAKEVTVLTGRTPEEVDRPESLAALGRATGVWFGGGRQWRFVDAYESSQALEEIRGVLRRGGVIGGSSAGASIQAEYMVRGNPLGNREMMARGYERGFGFLPGAAVDQHFSQRNRFADMASLMRRHPQLLGIGIDEATAIVVRGGVAEVIGQHRVCFYDGGEGEFLSVAAGGKFDLVERKAIDPPAE